MRSVNGAQFLNITPLFLLPNRLFASAAFSGPSVTVIVPLANMYASL